MRAAGSRELSTECQPTDRVYSGCWDLPKSSIFTTLGGVLECSDIYAVGSVVSPTSGSNGDVHVFTQTPMCFKIASIRERMS